MWISANSNRVNSGSAPWAARVPAIRTSNSPRRHRIPPSDIVRIVPLMLRLLFCATVVLGLAGLAALPAADALADFKPYNEKVGEASFDMVPIPGGTFTMGSPESEKGHAADEEPLVKVQVGPFWMAKVET